MNKIFITLILGGCFHLSSAQNFIDTTFTIATDANVNYYNTFNFEGTLGSGVYLIQVTDKSTNLVYFGRVIVE
jgi:hypothetical protein